MDAGAIIALAGLIVTIIALVGGGMVRSRDAHIAELKREKEQQRLEYEAKVLLAEQAADTRAETITELKSQLQRLQITAEITDRFLNQLPRQLPPIAPSGDR